MSRKPPGPMSRILAMLVACASSSLALAPGPLPASHELRSSHAVGVGVARPPLTPRASEPLLVATSGEADPQYGLLKSFRFDELRISGRQGLPGGKIDAHYSSRYWLVSLMNMHRSLVLRRIRSQLVFNVLVTCLILGARTVGFRPAVPITMHTLLGGFVSLLLVFRTNSAYARFWEARIIWGGVKNTCIDIVLAICANVRPRAPQAAADLVSALQLYPGSLSCQCRAEPPDGNLDPYALCLRMHKAVALAAAEVDASGPDRRDSVGVRLFELQLSRLNGDITNTPVPLSYSRHTSRFLTVWLGTLPFVLAGAVGARLTLPCVIVACWLLLGIEELGHLIEQPFEVHSRLGEVRKLKDSESYDVGVPTRSLANNIVLGCQALVDLKEPATPHSPPPAAQELQEA